MANQDDEPVTVAFPTETETSRFSPLIPSQKLALVSRFVLSSGVVLTSVPVAYSTWGRLDPTTRSNVMVICHALTGSSDVEDWWGPLMGPDQSFDPTRWFIFCANVLGSPYGTASPVTTNPETGTTWGPEFPATTTRDDVRLHEIVLRSLGVESVAMVVGGSMGGMAVLEWPLSTSTPGFVKNVVPIATCARHSAWGISWGEAQRQSIYSDPKYLDGYYPPEDPPSVGLAAARMAALLTYRSRDSFESRFGRKEMEDRRRPEKVESIGWVGNGVARTPAERALAAHNDGHRPSRRPSSTPSSPTSLPPPATKKATTTGADPIPHDRRLVFSAQSYLRYQGDKFVSRFDANCYIHLTRKMDAHDVDRGRLDGLTSANGTALERLPAGALVVSVSTDGLFMRSEQEEIAESIPDSRLVVVESPDGHDGFLLEFEQLNSHLVSHFRSRCPDVYSRTPLLSPQETTTSLPGTGKESLFGEKEGDDDMAQW